MRILPGIFVAVLTCLTGITPNLAWTQIGDPELLDSGLSAESIANKPYLDYARECADLMMEYGTDRYGALHSPMLMSILDVRTRTCPENPLPYDEAYRVTRRERRNPTGGNFWLDQAFLRVLLDLSEITGDPKYALFASKTAEFTMRNLVDEKGFFWWGWHRHYDAYRDEMTGHMGNVHEAHIQQGAWPELWAINQEAVTREMEAIWEWHIVDKMTGECNRHGDQQHGCDFAMSGGEYLAAFAFLYTKTQDPVWLDRAKLIADYYWSKRNPETNLIPNQPNAGTDRFDGSHFDTSISGLYCHRLLKAYELTGDPLFRDQASAHLGAYGKYGYDEKEKQFWAILRLDGTPERGPAALEGYEKYQPREHIDLWEPYAAGYQFPIYTAQAYAYAFQLTRDEQMLTNAQRWAECIRKEFPPDRCKKETWYGEYAEKWAQHGTYAEKYARTISFFLHLHALTGEQADLDFAKTVANEAISKLYYRGLFRGH
ncbi:MAG TPA: hypothetical protein PK395_14745, partial [bacterium]|nr:hypothetical protein [bacterium]